jgi:glucosamine--fructose-6-phosphate aminotransferase (isomerizing)
MCGIVAATARRNVVPILIEGLKRLEYRGYDSAGLAVVGGTLRRLRSTGRVAKLGALVDERNFAGSIGIAHTRWATHGVPSEANAHPHVSGGISVVHNGIIENHEAMRAGLIARGYAFTSETDSEVIAHLVHEELAAGGGLLEAVRRATRRLEGAYAIAIIAEDEPDRMVVARMGAPLLLGLGEQENFAASDVSALIQVTQRMIFLEDGDCADLTPDSVRVVERGGRVVERPLHHSKLGAEAVELGNFRHYMQKRSSSSRAPSPTRSSWRCTATLFRPASSARRRRTSCRA